MHRLPLILILLVAGAAAAAIYKWVDEQGRVHYGDSTKDKQGAQQIETRPGPAEADVRDARQRAQRLIDQQLGSRPPQEVLGTVTIAIAPAALARLPQAPIELTLLIESLSGGNSIKHRISDPNRTWEIRQQGKQALSEQNFQLALPPDDYRITEILAKARDLADESFTLVRKGPGFSVPQGNCVYVGRLFYTYTRLPVLSLAQAKAALLKLTRQMDKPLSMLYLTTGTLIPVAKVVDVPQQTEQAHANEILAKAREMNCAQILAQP